jgi:hypothetical protein
MTCLCMQVGVELIRILWLGWDVWLTIRSGHLTHNTQYPLYRRPGWLWGWSGRHEKFSPPPAFETHILCNELKVTHWQWNFVCLYNVFTSTCGGNSLLSTGLLIGVFGYVLGLIRGNLFPLKQRMSVGILEYGWPGIWNQDRFLNSQLEFKVVA